MTTLIDTARIAGAVARITRFITTDDVPGQWWIKDPIDHAMHRWRDRQQVKIPDHLQQFGPVFARGYAPDPWWWRYREGLDCPWCVGVHVAFWVLVVEEATRHAPPKVRAAWELVTAALAVSFPAAAAVAYTAGDDD